MKYTLLFSPSEGVRYADRQRLHTKNRAKVRKKNGMCKFFEWKMKKTPEIPEKPAIPERTKNRRFEDSRNRGNPHAMWEKKHNTSANRGIEVAHIQCGRKNITHRESKKRKTLRKGSVFRWFDVRMVYFTRTPVGSNQQSSRMMYRWSLTMTLRAPVRGL